MLSLRKTSRFPGVGHLANMFNKLARPGQHEGDAYVRACLEQCEDLSSSSVELQGKIKDAASEYHLSPARANLIRCLDLEGVNRVLELGSGCGPITRYLGEQGLAVDAVESCPDKYVLTKMRCRDLGNVRVIQADYQDLVLPPASYDIIFMIGLLDNPLFLSPRNSLASFQGLVRRVRKFLRPDGILVAAVDKRSGIRSSPNPRRENKTEPLLQDNIREQVSAYGEQRKWREIFMDEGEETCVFAYPFPDYRFPRVLLGDDFIASDVHSYSLLYRILRKNEGLEWRTDEDEFFHRKTLHESGRLAEAASSYLILSSVKADSIKDVASFDFVHFSSEIRRLEYRTCTVKLRGENRVVKRVLRPGPSFSADNGPRVMINELESTYERGPLVAILWMEACRHRDFDVFETSFSRLLRDYQNYVRQQAACQQDTAAIVDLLPSNLVAADDQAQYRAIDQEWMYCVPFSTDFILFRAFLWFGYHNRSSLAKYCGVAAWKTVRDFVAYCFAILDLPLGERIDEFAVFEDGFHAEIAVSGFSFSTWGVLDAALQP